MDRLEGFCDPETVPVYTPGPASPVTQVHSEAGGWNGFPDITFKALSFPVWCHGTVEGETRKVKLVASVRTGMRVQQKEKEQDV